MTGLYPRRRTPHPPSLREGTFSHKGRREEPNPSKNFASPVGFRSPSFVLNPSSHSTRHGAHHDCHRRDHAGFKPGALGRRILSGLVVVFLMVDGAIKLVPWPVVTETMDRMGYGSSETLARSLGIITIVCTVLYSIPPTSILGAILLTGYLGGAMASHVRIGSPLFTHTLFGLYLGLMAWGGLWLRDRNLRTLIPFRR
jgi:hypothetical protein